MQNVYLITNCEKVSWTKPKLSKVLYVFIKKAYFSDNDSN